MGKKLGDRRGGNAQVAPPNWPLPSERWNSLASEQQTMALTGTGIHFNYD